MINKVIQIWRIGQLYVKLIRSGLSVYEMYRLADGRISVRVAPSTRTRTESHFATMSHRNAPSRTNTITAVVDDLEALIAEPGYSYLMNINPAEKEVLVLSEIFNRAGFEDVDVETATYGSKWVTLAV